MLDRRFVHFVDSQVAMLCLAKGRSSSSSLCFIIQRIASTLLAASLSPIFAYVTSADNPADGPSRWLKQHYTLAKDLRSCCHERHQPSWMKVLNELASDGG
jgi:hypothetical protein